MERRRTQGVAGDWEFVATTTQPPSDAAPLASSSSIVDVDESLKRAADSPLDTEDSRQFKLRKKTVSVGLGEIYDPGVIPITLKKKDQPIPSVQNSPPNPASAPKWTKVQWKSADEDVRHGTDLETTVHEGGGDENASVDAPSNIKSEPDSQPEAEQSSSSRLRDVNSVKSESCPVIPAPDGGGSLFRKRKAPGGAGRAKRQLL